MNIWFAIIILMFFVAVFIFSNWSANNMEDYEDYTPAFYTTKPKTNIPQSIRFPDLYYRFKNKQDMENHLSQLFDLYSYNNIIRPFYLITDNLGNKLGYSTQCLYYDSFEPGEKGTLYYLRRGKCYIDR